MMNPETIAINAIAAQRNAALNQTVDAIVTAELCRARTETAYAMLRDVLLSGQIPDECVQTWLAKNTDFAAWYKSNTAPH